MVRLPPRHAREYISNGAILSVARQREFSLKPTIAGRVEAAAGSAERTPSVAEVLAAGRRLASDPRQARRGGLDLPAGLEQWSVLLAKK